MRKDPETGASACIEQYGKALPREELDGGS
jgi:hypothetical protein